MATAQKEYTVKQIVRLLKVTPRQLQWWHENGYLRAEVRGHVKFYRAAQLDYIRRYAQLCKAQITNKLATRLLRRGFDVEALAAAIKLVRKAGFCLRRRGNQEEY